MYKLERVTSNNTLKKMHRFFRKLGVSDRFPSLIDYKKYMNLGEAWVIVDESNSIVGGLLQYSGVNHNAIISYYVPEDTRGKGISWKIFDKCRKFQLKTPHKKTYATAMDISQWKRFAKKVKDDLYEVMIPKRRY